MVLVGPSGCGKSTTLRMLAGLEEVNSGNIFIGDRDVTSMSPKDRDIAMVFQNYALYPHMTVAENMAFALKMAKVPQEERDQAGRRRRRSCWTWRRSGAQAEGAVRWSAAAGGDGSCDRAAAAGVLHGRAAVQPGRQDAGVDPHRHRQAAGAARGTTVYVTHDQVEAMTMGDRVAVIKVGDSSRSTPRWALYDRPVNLFVAGFIGSPAMNLATFKIHGDHANLGRAKLPLSRATLDAVTAEGSDSVVLGFRPESLSRCPRAARTVPGHRDRGRGAWLRRFPVRQRGRPARGRRRAGTRHRHHRPHRPTQPTEQGRNGVVRIREGEERAFSVKTGERLPS